MAPASSKAFCGIQTKYRVLIHSETRTWHDNNIQSSAPYRWVLITQLNQLASLAEWLSVHLRTKWLWLRMSSLSLKSQMWPLLQARSSLTLRQTIECGFTLKLVRDMMIIYNQMHRTYKYSHHSSIIWPVWLNDWVFIYKLGCCVFDPRCSHLHLRYGAYFQQGIPWHSGKYRVWIYSETRTWGENIQSNASYR